MHLRRKLTEIDLIAGRGGGDGLFYAAGSIYSRLYTAEWQGD
jgi:hypothetical protein